MKRPCLKCFVDFKQAYDRVYKKSLYKAIEEINIPAIFINLTRTTINNAKGIVRIQQQSTEDFRIEEELKQGDGLDPVLFNIVLKKAVKDMNVDITTELS